MTVLPLDELLTLVGELNDSPDADSARQRFRRYVHENIRDLQLLAVYIDGCNGAPDSQRARAFQDLVTRLGGFLGFEVSYGAYRELPGRIGFDGRWRSALGVDVIVEVKTAETFSARRAGLARSIESLIAQGEIVDWSHVLGLYVIGGEDVPTGFLERLILDEPQSHRVRTISVSSLHTLAELCANQTLTHAQVLDLMRSGAPRIDPLVDIVARVDSRASRQFVKGLALDGRDAWTQEAGGEASEGVETSTAPAG